MDEESKGFEIGITSNDDYGPEYPAFSLPVKDTDTMGQIKERIEQRIKVSSQHFCIRKHGSLDVENEKTVLDYLDGDERDHLGFVLMYIPQFLIRVRFTRSDQIEEQVILLTEKRRKNLGDLVEEIEKRFKLRKGELRCMQSSDTENSGDDSGGELHSEWLINLWRKKKFVLNFETDQDVADKNCCIM